MRIEKLDPGAALAYQAYLDRADDPDRRTAISVVLTLDGDVDAVAAAGFEVHWTGGNEAVGTLRWDNLDAITELPEVVRIAAGMPRRPRLDTAAFELRARATTVASIGTDGLWHVAKPTGTLTVGGAGASGAGVIVGVIDTGIDISHPAFCSAQVPYRSRILKIWDQGLTPVVAAGEKGPDVARLLSAHTYGVEFDTAAIETALNTSVYPALPVDFRHKDCDGHGTHVASIAAGGNQVAGGSDASFVGIAPAADIIVVKMLDVPDVIRDDTGTEVGADVQFRDAVMYILREAAAQVPTAKPVVVNASFGSSFEPGDGLGADELFLDNVFDPAHAADPTHVPNGAIFVKASGNDGDPTDRGHAIVTIPDSGQIVVPFELFDDRGPNKASKINCQSVPHVPPVLATAWYREVTAPADVGFSAKVPGDAAFSDQVFAGSLTKFFDGGKRRTLFHESFTVARPPPPATVSVVRNRMMLFVEPKKLPPPGAPLHREGIYELRFTGPPGTLLQVMGTIDGTDFGRFGLRIATEYQNHDPLPGPEIVNGSATPIELIDITSRQTIADGGGRNVITVAAYNDLTGDLADFSSRGPLRDYSNPPLGPLAAKPEIAAPGVKINAALSQDSDDGVARLLTPGSVAGNRFIEFQGTSMAAPTVAGIVALMLEKNAALNVNQVRTALTASAAGRDGANPGPGDPGYADAFGAGRPAALESHTNT
jgi:subtilisin family serine protease